jgi:oligosaccharide reducing-end xylanase
MAEVMQNLQLKFLSLCTVVFTALALSAGTGFAEHRVAPWPENRKGAVSLTFDDGCVSHRLLGFSALEERGYRGTFFLVSDSRANVWESWKEAAQAGHEIGSHTKTHPRLPRLTAERMREEMEGSRNDIEARIPFRKIHFFSYPFGDMDPKVMSLAKGVYEASRGGGVDCGLNDESVDFLNVKGCSPDDGNDIYGITDAAERQGKWLVAIFHSLDGGRECYGSWTFRNWTAYLDYLKTKDLWVGTFGDVVKYLRSRLSSTITVTGHAENRITITLRDSLDDGIYDRPLTIRSKVPAGWGTVYVHQGNTTTEKQPVLEGEERVIYYDAVPDRGPVTLRKSLAER